MPFSFGEMEREKKLQRNMGINLLFLISRIKSDAFNESEIFYIIG
jgi:hypothetical protein